MKRVTASDARRNWFRLLDEVAAGEVVVVERNGVRIVLLRDDLAGVPDAGHRPDYAELIRCPDAGAADAWTWDWDEEGGLVSRDHHS